MNDEELITDCVRLILPLGMKHIDASSLGLLIERFKSLRAEHEALKAKYSRLAEICTRLVSSALPLIYCENGGSEIQNPKEKPRQS